MRTLYSHYFNLRLENTQCIPEDMPYIIAANHSSHLDIGAILSALSRAQGPKQARKLHVLGARDYFFDKPAKSWFFSTLFNVVPIRREQTGLEGLRMAKAILSNGEPVLIFPEATRTRTGSMQTFKPGLGLLALEADVPIVPAHIHGTYEALPAGKRVPKPQEVRVAFGPPVTMDRYRSNGGARAPRDEVYRRIAGDVRSAIERLAPAASAPGPPPA